MPGVTCNTSSACYPTLAISRQMTDHYLQRRPTWYRYAVIMGVIVFLYVANTTMITNWDGGKRLTYKELIHG